MYLSIAHTDDLINKYLDELDIVFKNKRLRKWDGYLSIARGQFAKWALKRLTNTNQMTKKYKCLKKKVRKE